MIVSEYISNYISLNGISHVFSVTGGYAMFLNDAFGKNNKIKNIYTHGEQGASYAAVGYTKSSNIPCVVSTTAGVAAMNATSGALVAFQESLPILFISGQVNKNETTSNMKTNVRHYSGQDCNIIESVKNITKYSVEIQKSTEIKYHLDKIFYEMTNGRPGPCWLSVPLDIQNDQIYEEELVEFSSEIIIKKNDYVMKVLSMLKNSNFHWFYSY